MCGTTLKIQFYMRPYQKLLDVVPCDKCSDILQDFILDRGRFKPGDILHRIWRAIHGALF